MAGTKTSVHSGSTGPSLNTSDLESGYGLFISARIQDHGKIIQIALVYRTASQIYKSNALIT